MPKQHVRPKHYHALNEFSRNWVVAWIGLFVLLRSLGLGSYLVVRVPTCNALQLRGSAPAAPEVFPQFSESFFIPQEIFFCRGVDLTPDQPVPQPKMTSSLSLLNLKLCKKPFSVVFCFDCCNRIVFPISNLFTATSHCKDMQTAGLTGQKLYPLHSHRSFCLHTFAEV